MKPRVLTALPIVCQKKRGVLGLVLAGLVVALTLFPSQRSVSAQTQASGGYRVLKKTILGGTAGWDYLSMDSANRHLFIGRMQYIDVFDVDTDKVAAKLNIADVGGISLVPEFNRGFTNGGNGVSRIIDLKTLRQVGTVKNGTDPDSYAYDPLAKRVFFMQSAGHAATAIDAASGKFIGTLPLGGQPEFAVSDGKGHIFVNITDKNQMLEFDAQSLKVLHRWSLAPCEGPSGLSMDREHRRLFSACDNEMMAVMDADSGRVVATLPTGAGTDASVFDPATQNAFASAGGCGELTVIHEYSPDEYRVVQNVPTASGARTMALDTQTHDILLVTAAHGHGATHNEILPHTFQVLVVGR